MQTRLIEADVPARAGDRGRASGAERLRRIHLRQVGRRRPQYLGRALDRDGKVLDLLVQPGRDKRAAKKFFRNLLKALRYVPRGIITDRRLPRKCNPERGIAPVRPGDR
jgi:transposase-like protein